MVSGGLVVVETALGMGWLTGTGWRIVAAGFEAGTVGALAFESFLPHPPNARTPTATTVTSTRLRNPATEGAAGFPIAADVTATRKAGAEPVIEVTVALFFFTVCLPELRSIA